MKLLFFFFLIESYLILSAKYVFDDTKQFISQIDRASIDELVYILTKLEKYKPQDIRVTLSPEQKYSAGRAKLLSSIGGIMDKEAITFVILRDNVLEEGLARSASEEIKSSKWYQKVAWVMNADLYYLKMQMRKPQIGGIIDYVNYLPSETLDKYLYELLEAIPSLKEDYSLFENEIVNRKPLPDDLLKYLESQNITTLNEWGLRLYQHITKPSDRACSEINSILNITSPSVAFLYINKYLQRLDLSSNNDNFFKYIVYNNHSFPLLKQKLLQMTRDDIRSVSHYVESYHRRAVKSSKSFDDLNDYINRIPKEYLIGYIVSESRTYPELNEVQRAKDFNQIQSLASLSNVNNLMLKKDRDMIMMWALNIHDFHDFDSNATNVSEYFYSKSTESILEEMINNLKNKTVEYSYDKVFEIGNPKNNDTENFRDLLTQHPPIIQRKWLIKLQEFHQNKSSAPETPEELRNSAEILIGMMKYINLYKLTREKFGEWIEDPKDAYTMAFGNFASYFYAIQKKELIVWLRKVEEHIRTTLRLAAVIGGIQSVNIANIEKRDIIEQLLTYIELFPELKDFKKFDEVIGMNMIHSSIHNSNKEALEKYARALRKYHDIKLIKLKTSESSETKIEKFVSKADESHLMLYIFRIMAMLPELNIKSVWDEVMQLGDDQLREVFNKDTFLTYLSSLPREKLIIYCKQCSRLTNSLRRTFINDDCQLKENENLLWNITTTVFDVNNEILRKTINFLRLMRGSEEMIYGGLEPFIFRQPDESLDLIIRSLPILLFANEKIDIKKLLKESRQKKVESIMNVIYKNNMNDLKTFDDFLYSDTTDMLKQLHSLNKTQLGYYALVAEDSLRQTKYKAMEHYEVVSDKYLQMTKNELIRFILKSKLSIDDLEVRSKMVLLTIGERDYEKLL